MKLQNAGAEEISRLRQDVSVAREKSESLPFSVTLTLCCNDDEPVGGKGEDRGFEMQLREDVSYAVGIGKERVQVVWWEREGGVRALVVVSCVGGSQGVDRSAEDVARELVGQAGVCGSKLGCRPVGMLVRGAELRGPVSGEAWDAVCGCVATYEAGKVRMMQGTTVAMDQVVALQRERACYAERIRMLRGMVVQGMEVRQLSRAFSWYVWRVRVGVWRRRACDERVRHRQRMMQCRAFDVLRSKAAVGMHMRRSADTAVVRARRTVLATAMHAWILHLVDRRTQAVHSVEASVEDRFALVEHQLDVVKSEYQSSLVGVYRTARCESADRILDFVAFPYLLLRLWSAWKSQFQRSKLHRTLET